MKVSKEKALANRETLVAEAGRLFRAHGIDGVGVLEVARSAGLTHGALYAHFPSKDALAAEALSVGLERSLEALVQSSNGKTPTFSGYLEYLLSPRMRDTVEMGCPMTAAASEIGRQDEEVSARFTSGVERVFANIQDAISGERSEDEKRKLAMTAIAAEIGAISIARAVSKSDPSLSNEILSAVRSVLMSLDDRGSTAELSDPRNVTSGSIPG